MSSSTRGRPVWCLVHVAFARPGRLCELDARHPARSGQTPVEPESVPDVDGVDLNGAQSGSEDPLCKLVCSDGHDGPS